MPRPCILAAGIAVVGFVATLMTGSEVYTYRAPRQSRCWCWIFCYPEEIRMAWDDPTATPTSASNPASATARRLSCVNTC